MATQRTKDILIGHVFAGAALAILLPVYWSYRMVLGMPSFKTEACVAAMVAGVGATICLAGAMIFLNKPLCDILPPIWYVRMALHIERRVIVVLQLATTALVVGAAGVLAFHLRVPAVF